MFPKHLWRVQLARRALGDSVNLKAHGSTQGGEQESSAGVRLVHFRENLNPNSAGVRVVRGGSSLNTMGALMHQSPPTTPWRGGWCERAFFRRANPKP